MSQNNEQNEQTISLTAYLKLKTAKDRLEGKFLGTLDGILLTERNNLSPFTRNRISKMIKNMEEEFEKKDNEI